MIDTLLQPFQFGFMVNGFWIAAIVSVPTAMLSCFLVLRGRAPMGDAVSHAVLPGIVPAYFPGAPLILGAFVAGIFTAVTTGYLADNGRFKPDTVTGALFSGIFAVDIVLYVAPGAIAFLLVRQFRTMLWVAVPVRLVSMLGGTRASFFLGSAPAPTVMPIPTAPFLTAFTRRVMPTRRVGARI